MHTPTTSQVSLGNARRPFYLVTHESQTWLILIGPLFSGPTRVILKEKSRNPEQGKGRDQVGENKLYLLALLRNRSGLTSREGEGWKVPPTPIFSLTWVQVSSLIISPCSALLQHTLRSHPFSTSCHVILEKPFPSLNFGFSDQKV